jgi:ketosteroid isomerase-like protein
MNEDNEALIGRLFSAFNRRDTDSIVALCSLSMEFGAVTGEEVGREAPYSGREGLREYLTDVEQVWDELLITPSTIECRGEQLLVCGRVYARSRELGIRDMPAAWIWQVRDGLFVRGEVFADPARAIAHFDRVTA